MENRFSSFAEFYPFYLSQHGNRICRRLHFVGTSLVILIFFYALIEARFALLWLIPIVGYGFAWIGHFVFEKNKPATFKYPFYSLAGDFVMYKDMFTRRITF